MSADAVHLDRTVDLVRSFVTCDKELTERLSKSKEEKEIFLADIKEYVTLTNPLLFRWARDAADSLAKSGIGEASLEFHHDQSQLFSVNKIEFSRYPVKQFSELRAVLKISMRSAEKVTLRADITFRGGYGRFEWDDGRDDYFFSQPHLASDQERFGPLDIFDIMSVFGARDLRDRAGKDRQMGHPVEIINKRLEARIRATLEGKIFGKQPRRRV